MALSKSTGCTAFTFYLLAVFKIRTLLLVKADVNHNSWLGEAGMTAAVTVYWGQEGEKSMAAVFRVTRNALLKRKNNIDTACGKVFDFIRRVAAVQKETLAHHIVCAGPLAAS